MILRLLAILALLLVVGYLGISSTQRNQGDFTYALDDTYIHLAVTQNFATHGVWGINPDAFSSCTSSLVWPALLRKEAVSPSVLTVDFATYSFPDVNEMMDAPPVTFGDLVTPLMVVRASRWARPSLTR